jgi:hypothetical protein
MLIFTMRRPTSLRAVQAAQVQDKATAPHVQFSREVQLGTLRPRGWHRDDVSLQ